MFGFPLDIDPSTVMPDTPPSTDYQAWYDASDTSTIRVVTGVAQWDDKSLNHYDLGQGTAANQPAYSRDRQINRVTCPDFDGSTDRLEGVQVWFAGAYSWFGVIKPDNVSAFQAIVASTGTNSAQVAIETTGEFEHLREGTAFTYTQSGKLLRVGEPAVVGVSFQQISGDDQGRIIVDKTYEEEFRNDSGGYNNGGPMRIGARSNLTNFYDGLIGEMIFYTRFMERHEMQRITAYLMNKWGI